MRPWVQFMAGTDTVLTSRMLRPFPSRKEGCQGGNLQLKKNSVYGWIPDVPSAPSETKGVELTSAPGG